VTGARGLSTGAGALVTRRHCRALAREEALPDLDVDPAGALQSLAGRLFR
jgi:hypothetical protein